jgi:hypothetical protein
VIGTGTEVKLSDRLSIGDDDKVTVFSDGSRVGTSRPKTTSMPVVVATFGDGAGTCATLAELAN